MSEYINNTSQRKEALLRVLRGLHTGLAVDQVKSDFAELARQATAAEIAEAEQLLIEEGVHPSEIQSLCDVHVSVVREGLDLSLPAEMTPGHPVYTFKAENRAIEKLLEQMRAAVEEHHGQDGEGKAQNAFPGMVEKLQQVDVHFRRKEHLLFPFLERYGFMGPSQVMWGLHDQIRAQIKGLVGRSVGDGLASAFAGVDEALRGMIYKEEKILFPASLERLAHEDWGAIAEQESEIGYCLVDPAALAHQAIHDHPFHGNGGAASNLLQIGETLDEAALESTVREGAALAAGDRAVDRDEPSIIIHPNLVESGGPVPFALDTGILTLEQIRLIFTHLPVDVTFVDENDTVRFFSQTRQRIFDRPAAVIGRKVQNCHPPHSVHRVQKILDDFRAGQRDEAAFWIQMKGMFVHIAYYAVRSKQGEYQGTLEVTQDLTPLRALEGERRLLDE